MIIIYILILFISYINTNKIVIDNLEFIINIRNNLSLPRCGLSGRFARIANGKNSVEGSYPFAALLFRHSMPFAGAVIISERWLLTAAHIFHYNDDNYDDDSLKSSIYSVGLGAININNLIKKKIDRIILHEKYRKNYQNFDLALIRLKKSLRFGQKIRPICLPDYPYEKIDALKRGRIIGWGYRNFSNETISQILQEVDLDILPLHQCRHIYSKLKQDIFRSQICTYTIDKDACTGDSGGPFFVYKNNRATLFGIIGFGVTCADNFPGVITAVSYFLHWINKILIENQ